MNTTHLQHEYTKLMNEAYNALTRKEAIDCINRATKLREAMGVAKEAGKA